MQLTHDQLLARIKQEQQKQFLQDLHAILQSRAGRSVFCRLLDISKVNQLSFNQDPYQTAKNEGMREVGLEFTSNVLMLPDGFGLKQLAEQEYNQRGNEILVMIQEEFKDKE